ncbi:putative DNA-binding transcriptional regulator AlpA [Pedobacter sp. UYEF25]
MKIDIYTASKLANLSQFTIRDYCAKRKIPHYKIGGRLSFDEAEILGWVSERTQKRGVKNA